MSQMTGLSYFTQQQEKDDCAADRCTQVPFLGSTARPDRRRDRPYG